MCPVMCPLSLALANTGVRLPDVRRLRALSPWRLLPRSKPRAKTVRHLPHVSRRELGLPALAEFGVELQHSTRIQQISSAVLPLLSGAAFCSVLVWQCYLLLPLILLAHFIVSVNFTHDVLHGTAGLSRRSTDWALFGMSLLLLESGHAFRQAHLHHHSHCLEEDDFEGSPAYQSLSGALAAGPTYLIRHWLHAFRLAKNPVQKRWMQAEAGSALLLLAMALLVLPSSSAPLAYIGLMWLGSWLYPLTTAWLPHFRPDTSLAGQARTLRGKIIPTLFLNLTYHLEHHLYPQVPSHNLARLAQKLDPHLAARGVDPLRVF